MHFGGALDAKALKVSITAELAEEEYWRVVAVGALLHEDTELDAWLSGLPAPLQGAAVQTGRLYGHLGYLLLAALENDALHLPLQTGPSAQVIKPEEAYDNDSNDNDKNSNDDEEDE